MTPMNQSQVCVRIGGAFAALLMSVGLAHASVEISTAATSNMSCSGGVCSPTAKKAVLNVNDLTDMLSAGDVKVTTGAGAVTITISAPFSWTSTSRLTLDATQNVSFKAPVTVAGTGAVSITYNDGGTGGDLLFFPGAKLDFWDTSSSLVINTHTYTLVDNRQSLSARTSGFVALGLDYNAEPDGSYSASPLASFGNGLLEGLGHVISNLSVKAPSDSLREIALIQVIAADGKVRDIGVRDATMGLRERGDSTFVYGALLVAVNHGIVQHSYGTGKIAGGGTTFLGGIAGDNFGTIQDSYANVVTGSHSDGTVNGYVGNGGLVGQNETTGVVSWSHSVSSVHGKHYEWMGGLIGVNLGQVLHSWSSGEVAGSNWLGTGGLVGWNVGTIAYSHSNAEIQTFDSGSFGGAAAGGLAGYNDSGTSGVGVIRQSFSTGLVQGGQNMPLGGLVGRNSGTVENSYSTAAVKLGAGASGLVGGLVSQNGGFGYGGIIGHSYSVGTVSLISGGDRGGFVAADATQELKKDYWDLDTSGVSDPSEGAGNIPNDPGITGLADIQLKSGLPTGFDPAIWGQKKNINNGYPYLLANPPPQ